MQKIALGTKIEHRGSTLTLGENLRCEYSIERASGITSPRVYNMHNDQLKAFMGLPPKLPLHRVDPMLVGNIRVWVEAHGAIGLPRRNRPHRVMAQCPKCNATVPAGRLFQHKCKGYDANVL